MFNDFGDIKSNYYIWRLKIFHSYFKDKIDKTIANHMKEVFEYRASHYKKKELKEKMIDIENKFYEVKEYLWSYCRNGNNWMNLSEVEVEELRLISRWLSEYS